MLRGVWPDFRTIADFRRDNQAAFKAVFREFVLLCRKLDLFRRELLAVDETRLKAVNGRARKSLKVRHFAIFRPVNVQTAITGMLDDAFKEADHKLLTV